MFHLYKGQSEMFYFWWVLGLQALSSLFSLLVIPFPLALGYEMTPDYHERTRLQAYASFFAQPVWMSSLLIHLIQFTSKVVDLKIWKWTIVNFQSPFTDITHAARVIVIIVGIR